jgi:hypothetical protein
MATESSMKYAAESRTSMDKPLGDFDLVENLPGQNIPHFYAPRTQQEAALDRSINMKLDLIVLPLLAFNFMVGSPFSVEISKRLLIDADKRNSCAV